MICSLVVSDERRVKAESKTLIPLSKDHVYVPGNDVNRKELCFIIAEL